MIDELIEKEEYEQALVLIGSKDDEDSLYQKATCLFGLKRYKEALEAVKEGVAKSSKKYYDMLALEVLILVQLEQDDEALKILEEELSMPYIPDNYETLFRSTYESLVKKKNANEKQYSPFDLLSEEELKELISPSKESEVIFLAFQQLAKRNVRQYMDVVSKYLQSDAKDYYKTVLLEILQDQGIDVKIDLKHAGKMITVNPSKLEPLINEEMINDMSKYLVNMNEDKDVSINQDCYDILMNYLGNIYPEKVDKEEYKNLAAAIYWAASEAYKKNFDIGTLIRKFDCELSKVMGYYGKINALPIIF